MNGTAAHRVPAARTFVPVLCLSGAILLWGTSFVAAKTAMVSLRPMTLVWLRMAVASIVMLPFWSRVRKPSYRKGDWQWLALLCLFQPCLYFLFEANAIKYTTASQAGMICALEPLLVVVGARIFLSEALAPRAVAGLVVSLVGVTFLSLGGEPDLHAPDPSLGNALEFLAMGAAAGYMLVTKHLSERYSPWFLTGMQCLVGVVFFLPGVLGSGAEAWGSVTPRAWLCTAYLGSGVSLGAFGLYSTAVGRIPAGRAATSINAIPVVALVTGWLLLGEALSMVQAAACLVIIAGVLLGQAQAGREGIAEQEGCEPEPG